MDETIYDDLDNSQRPIMKLVIKQFMTSSFTREYPSGGIKALLDTGAVIPVWTGKEKLLRMLGATSDGKCFPFSGFGGTVYGKLYRLDFRLGGIYFPQLPIMAFPMQTSFKMILSATMLQRLRYEIDDQNHRLSITVPNGEDIVRNIEVKESNGRLHVFCQSDDQSKTDDVQEMNVF